MDTEPQPSYEKILPLLLSLADFFTSQVTAPRVLRIDIAPALESLVVFADPRHLALVFRNLFNNALRATERRRLAVPRERRDGFEEILYLGCERVCEDELLLIFKDNGVGIAPDLREKLYRHRCSDQRGKDHGLGAIIIRKLLDLNAASVLVLDTKTSGPDSGTTQRITLPCRKLAV